MDRQLHNEAAPLPLLADCPYASAVQQNDLTHDGQAKPGPAAVAAACLIDPIETVKHMREVLGLDTRAVIAYREYDIPSRPGDAQVDLSAVLRIFDGIIQQVVDDLPQL